MNKNDELKQNAVVFIKKNKQIIINTFAGPKYASVEHPISVFMAGSPGAGKTEFSKELVKTFEDEGNSEKIIRIDPDDVRPLLPGYTGSNSDLFQYPTSLAVEKIQDHALDKNKNFILDGTFANFEKAKSNIKRSLDKGRSVDIYYIYQDPIIAWEITQKREALEGRKVPKEVFVELLFGAYNTVNLLKQEFSEKISLNLFTRDAKQDVYMVKLNIDRVDKYLNINYKKDSLLNIL